MAGRERKNAGNSGEKKKKTSPNLARKTQVPGPPTRAEHTESVADLARPGFPVVGIGASAGGLDAFMKFFKAMPADSGMAFVLIPHLDPKHESLMVELLARQTQMPVSEAAEGQSIQVNHVYIIPPNKFLAIHDGRLLLTASRNHAAGRRLSILSSAPWPRTSGDRSIGIVLSGTGSHGTPGLKEIKLAGGMAMVQQPESADFDQMPTSAIATGLVDYVLTPEKMPEALIKYVRQPYLSSDPDEAPRDRDLPGPVEPHSGPVKHSHSIRLSLLSQEHVAAPHSAPHGALADRATGAIIWTCSARTPTRSSHSTRIC